MSLRQLSKTWVREVQGVLRDPGSRPAMVSGLSSPVRQSSQNRRFSVATDLDHRATAAAEDAASSKRREAENVVHQVCRGPN